MKTEHNLRYAFLIWLIVPLIVPTISQAEDVDFYLSDAGFMYVKLYLDDEAEGRYFLFDIDGHNFLRKDREEIYNQYQISKRKRTHQFSSIKFGGKEWPKTKFYIRDAIHEYGTEIMADSVVGCVGYHFMKAHCWRINYQRQKIIFRADRDSFKFKKSCLELYFTQSFINNSILLDVSLDHGIAKTFSISTAWPLGISADPDFTKGAKEYKENSKQFYPTFRLIKNLELRNYIVKSLTFDNKVTFFNVPVSTSERIGNMIGNDFLKHFVVTIDWKRKLIYLQPLNTYKYQKISEN